MILSDFILRSTNEFEMRSLLLLRCLAYSRPRYSHTYMVNSKIHLMQ